MTEQELHKLLEVQYLKGRLDELEYKAKPQVYNLERSRKLDVRIDKYYNKLKNTSEIAYHLHNVERLNLRASKQKSQKNIKEILITAKELLQAKYPDGEIIDVINKQLKTYE